MTVLLLLLLAEQTAQGLQRIAHLVYGDLGFHAVHYLLPRHSEASSQTGRGNPLPSWNREYGLPRGLRLLAMTR